MNMSVDPGSPLLRAYSLARRSGILRTSWGRRIFKSAYFLYKRYIEDDLRDLIKSFPDLVGEGDVLDVGANIGYTACVLAQTAKAGRKVYAFEPEPFNFRLLKQTSEQREFDGRIVPLQLAVGAEDGTIDLWINLGHHADHRVMTPQFQAAHAEEATVHTPLVSVDSFLDGMQSKVSFVKIDVQGYELAVCQGMQNTLRQNPDITVFLEFMPSAMRDLGFEPSDLIEFFVQRGFSIYQVHSRGRLTPGMPAVAEDSNYFDLLFSHRPLACSCTI